MNIGHTGRYVDAQENEYAALVVGRSFTVENGVKTETGKLEIVGTFRDGTTKLISNVDPSAISDPSA